MARKNEPLQEFTAAQLDELTEYHSYEEMVSRPKFVANIDSALVKPAKPIGYYPGLPERVRCGRSGCHKPQLKGLLVECDNGSETNIGEDCGEKLLGIHWASFIGGFRNKRRQKETLERIRQGVDQANQYAARLQEIIDRPQGARWLMKTLNAFRATAPPEIVSQLYIRSNRSEATILGSRQRTELELQLFDSEHAPAPSAGDDVIHRYERREDRINVATEVGTFVGLEVFALDGRTLIFSELTTIVRALAQLNPNDLSATERRKCASWLRNLDSDLGRAASWVDSGATFFTTASNKALLRHLIRDELAARRWNPDQCTWG